MGRGWWPAAGALAGAAWGGLFRLWMRFITDDPEFTWNGTLYIVLAPAVLGLLVVSVRVAYTTTWLRRLLRSVLAVLTLSLGVAAGSLFLPTLLFGTAAVAPARSPRWVRAVLLAAAALLPIALVGSAIGEREGSGAAGAAVAAVWYAAICLTAIGAYATAWRAPGSGHRIGAGAAQHPAGQRARELAAP
jgi:hypothetical protein